MYILKIGNIFEQSLKEIIQHGFSIKYFKNHSDLCLAGEDNDFIKRFMTKVDKQYLNLLLLKIFFKKKTTSRMLLKDKTAVITGCNRGIGLSTLKIFSKTEPT